MTKLHGNKRYSSLRTVSAETTLRYAKQWAKDAGVSRVTHISGLDRTGFPVCASIRPRSHYDAVTYGKGLLPIDAEVGAYMEAIEFKWAEPGSESEVLTRWGTPRDIAGADKSADAILDFSPLLEQRVELNQPILLVQAQDVENEEQVWLPAELVYHPAADIGQKLFGSSTNGLASGNSVLEASVHALTELIERDIWSFQFFEDTALTVDCSADPDRSTKPGILPSDTVPAELLELMESCTQKGLQFIVHYVPNEFELPFFRASLYDIHDPSTKYFNSGWGCHLHKDIALVRAVCEAAQSRVAVIHGARKFASNEAESAEQRQLLMRRIEEMQSQPETALTYENIPDLNSDSGLEDKWEVLVDRLSKVIAGPVYRVVFTPRDADLHVVRLVVPGLEYFKPGHMRIGRRLQAFMEAS